MRKGSDEAVLAMRCIRLGDVCEKIGSGATPRGGAEVYLSEGTALIRSQNVHNEGFRKDGLAFIDQEHASELQNVEVRAGDVLLNITGDSVARVCQAPTDVLPARVNQHVAIVRPRKDKLDAGYLRYFLVSPAMQARMLALAGAGATRNALTKGMIENFEIQAPPLPEQRAIAAILGALDDKIELNRRMNETLEAMARAIFKSWFVDFEPVRAKIDGRWRRGQSLPGLPADLYDLFPDSFQDSELGKIPRGWRIRQLSDVCSTQYGYTASASEEPVGPKFLRVTDINKRGWIEWETVPYCQIDEGSKAKYGLSVGDLLVARMADPGKVAIVEEPVDAVFASYLVRLKTRSLAYSYYLYSFLKSEHYSEYTEGAKSGSVQANMNARVIVGAKLAVPPAELLERFLQFALPVRQRLVAAVRESSSLRAIRDALLPKLISGEIRISNAKAMVREAV